MRNTQLTKESVKSVTLKSVTHIINQIVRASLTRKITRKKTSGLTIPILRRQSHATRSEKDWFDENTDIGIPVKVSKKC